MKQPFTITAKTRTYKGKVITFYQYSINPESGLPEWIWRDHQRKTIKAKSRNDAKQKVFSLIQDLKDSTPQCSKDFTFGKYSENFYLDGSCPLQKAAESEGRTIKVSYLKEYRNLFTENVQTDKVLYYMPLSNVTQGELLKARERMVERFGVTSKSRKSFKIIKQIISYAAARGDIPYNPGAGMKDIKDRPRERGVISQEEVNKLFPLEGNGPWQDEQDYLAFLLVYSCGLRKGELLGLRWGSVLFDRSAIIVIEALDDRTHYLGDPKKGKRRGCPVPQNVMKLLNAWNRKTKFPEPEDYVFCYQKRYRDVKAGTHFSGTWWAGRFRKALDKSKIDRVGRNITPHSFRHSVNTHLQDKGYSRDKLRQTLGWSSESVQDIYTHGDSMDHSGQAAIVDEILSVPTKDGKLS